MTSLKNLRALVMMAILSVGATRAGFASDLSDPASPAADAKPPILDWQSVQAGDYQTYVKNLQTIGCPDQTIRTIVTADIVAAFADKRQAALTERYQNFSYWKCDSAETSARAQLSAQRRSIDEAMNRIVQQVLGPATELPDANRKWEQNSLDFELSFLTATKRDAVIVILSTYSKEEEQMKELCGGQYLSEDTNELQHVLARYQEMQSTLQEVLSPAEFQQVDMTVSWTAENLRHALVHFQPTEAEFRIIFNAWRSHDEDLTRIYATRHPDSGNSAVFASIKQQLSPERYNEYDSTWWK